MFKTKIKTKTISDFDLAISLLQTSCQHLDLRLDFNNKRLTHAQMLTLTSVLQLKNSSPNVVLKLRGNKLGLFAMNEVAMIIQMGPVGLYLDLSFNEIDDLGMVILIRALTSGFPPNGLTIDLTGNLIGYAGSKSLATALQSTKWPLGLTLEFNGNQINSRGCRSLIHALQKHCPPGLYLGLDDNYIHVDVLLQIKALLRKNRKESFYAYVLMGLIPLMDPSILHIAILYLMKEPQKNIEAYKTSLLTKFFPQYSSAGADFNAVTRDTSAVGNKPTS